jgi:hypothetical protein
MRNYTFRLYVPTLLFDVRGDPIQIPEIANAIEDIGDFISSQNTGIPTHTGTGASSNVYPDQDASEDAVALVPIFPDAALNLFYKNNVLSARLAHSMLKETYCNAISSSPNEIKVGEKVKVKIGTGYIASTVHPVAPDTTIWLGSTPGLFTSSNQAIGAIVQPCGYSLFNKSIYFQYNKPALI